MQDMNATPRQCSDEDLVGAVRQILNGRGEPAVNAAVLAEISRRWAERTAQPSEDRTGGATA